MATRPAARNPAGMRRDDRRDPRSSYVEAWLLIGSGLFVVLLIVLL